MDTPFEFYVSYCLMTEKVNPFGHGCIIFTQIDHRLGNKARAEVLDGVGFYSRYMPGLGLKPYAKRGRVKAEEHQYIVDQEGLFHTTFQISADEMGEILTAINQDRNNIGDEAPNANGEYKPGGPTFNLFTGNNCKRYALQKFEQIGIDTKKMRGFLQIPKLTKGMQPLKIAKGQRESKDIYYWDCPLVVTPRNTQDTNRIKETTKCGFLKESIEKMLLILNARKQTLAEQGRKVNEINEAITNLEPILQELIIDESYPNRITSQKVNHWVSKVEATIKKETDSLKNKNIENNLIQILLDTIKETYYLMYNTYFGTGTTYSCNANTKDKMTFKEVENLQHRTRMSLK
ncbi:MAG: hypothetical protein JSS07_10615 [Proteobacteria bacterium]|nr:hypothetical protein [Pseudomonadota bacterium]